MHISGVPFEVPYSLGWMQLTLTFSSGNPESEGIGLRGTDSKKMKF